MDVSDVWTTLITDATKRAPCSDEASTCWLTIRYTPWYASIQHKDNDAHDCGLCNPEVPPTRIVSVESLQIVRREVLVARLALFLSHAHEYPATSGVGADRGAVDGHAPTPASDSGSVSGSAGASASGSPDRAAA